MLKWKAQSKLTDSPEFSWARMRAAINGANAINANVAPSVVSAKYASPELLKRMPKSAVFPALIRIAHQLGRQGPVHPPVGALQRALWDRSRQMQMPHHSPRLQLPGFVDASVLGTCRTSLRINRAEISRKSKHSDGVCIVGKALAMDNIQAIAVHELTVERRAPEAPVRLTDHHHVHGAGELRDGHAERVAHCVPHSKCSILMTAKESQSRRP